MWARISLRKRIYLILVSLVGVTVLGGLILVWYTYRMETVLTGIIDKNLSAFQTAEALEQALVNQKGFVSYYFMDRNPEWLKRLGEYRQVFVERLQKAESMAEDGQQKEAVETIDREYRSYVEGKDRVIALYMNGEIETGFKLHEKVRERYFKILELCEKYKEIHYRKIMEADQKSHIQAENLRFFAASAVLIVFCMGLFLAFVMTKQILDPLRRLAMETNYEGHLVKSEDEVKALSRSVHGLIKDAGQTHIELERSREHLLQSEKMAMVGKLAAGVAHSIRNPLTSVKMRLFSLSRSLKLNEYQQEDFEVISQEIRHTDTIVQNFLEFARPPKLKIQSVSPSVVVDQTLLLLEHRLKSYGVKINLIRKKALPEIQGDPEQLKEVLVNILVNACEAMGHDGTIVIEEEIDPATRNRAAKIRMTDNGPGIPESIRSKLFEPFFTTKDEGTGLGLSIAARIIEEHGGRMEVHSKEGEGATFIITLPINPDIS